MSNILSALRAIPVSALGYQEWINVGMALHAEGYDVSVWDEWSRNDMRYHPGECERKWKTFSSIPGGVRGGTIIQMARSRGWSEYGEDGVMDWNDVILDDGDGYAAYAAEKEKSPSEELITYLETLFEESDHVGYVTNDVRQDDEGRWVPSKGVYDRTAGELIASLRKHPDDIGAAVGDWKKEAGAWIRFNALDGEGVKNTNVTSFRYALVESDSMPLQEQDAMYRKLELPIACLVHSGGKSLHAIVRVDAEDYEEYRKRVEFLYDFLEKNGVSVDKQNRNPSRLSRMPGVDRNGIRQYLAAVNIGRRSWTDWLDFVEGVSDELPELVSLSDFRDSPPVPPPELIEGVLRCGHKMLISGSSKAGKSFLLMELCIAIAEGTDWLGFHCRKGKVLYVNLEIDPGSCITRFMNIYDALRQPELHMEDIVIWNLRGHAVPLDKLVPKLVRRVRNQQFSAVVIDPIYKVITGDENNASEMGAFCNLFDKICMETGCAAIYCHHHSKGAQGAKKAMDRASGSGVFARDPDAQLDMIQLELSEDILNNVRDGNATAWRLECSLREFPNFDPRNFWFEYPIHRVDDANLREAYAEGSPLANLARSGKRTSARERRDILDTAFQICEEDGTARLSEMAEYMGVAAKSIRRYIEEFGDRYTVKCGKVTRSESDEE